MHPRFSHHHVSYFILVLFLLSGCFLFFSEVPERRRSYPIVATTGMIADIIEHIVDDSFPIFTLIQQGKDPHIFKASSLDLWKIQQADIVFFNGLHLEGELYDGLVSMARQGQKVYPVSDALDQSDLLSDLDHPQAKDPHIWMDPLLWKKVTYFITEKLIAYAPKHKVRYLARRDAYISKLDALHQKAMKQLNSLSSSQKKLITPHDAFSYFAHRYGLEVHPVRGFSTEDQPDIYTRKDLVEKIIREKINIIYSEFSDLSKIIEAICIDCQAKGHCVRCIPLYTDFLGEKNTPEGTYLGMMAYNIRCIIQQKKEAKSNQSNE